MSGLCAAVTFDGSPVDRTTVYGMAAAAAHRGRDGVTAWFHDGVGLVQQVLAVTKWDRAVPPPHSAGLVVLADARLDNRAELVPLLESGGVLADGKTATDAEVVLGAHRLWGDACAGRLVGDFAFVVYDERRRRLFAARDPLGMRALYYRVDPRRRALLATEITQLLAAPAVPCEVDELGIAATLAGPYLPPDRTVYVGIAQLAPGHALAVDAVGARTWRFWRPDPSRLLDLDDDACPDAFRTTFGAAVAARTDTCGPIGIMLSGGMDSGAVASCAGWLREQDGSRSPVRTYSWAFAELPDADERSVSDEIVARYGLASTAVPADDAWPLADHLAHRPDRDDPFCWVYQGLIERTLDSCRSEGVGMVLSGDRGDEVTGDWIFDELGMLRHGRARDALADLRLLAAGRGMGMALRHAVAGPAARHLLPGIARPRTRAHGAPWVAPDLAKRVGLEDVIAEQSAPVRFDGPARSARASRIFMAQGARLAVLQERSRARYGLASSDPFSDRRVVELVLALPQWRVQRRGSRKHLARQAMAGIMPEPARLAATKTIPIGLFDRAFRDRSVGSVRSLLTGSLAAAHGWLDEAEALASFEQYRTTGDTVHDFWWPLCVEMWLRRWWS